LEKLEKYKEKYEEYKAEYEAYKELYNEYKEDYEKYKAEVESQIDSVQSTVDDVTSAADAVKTVAQNADAIIDSQVDKVKDKVGLSSDSSSSSTSSASSTVVGSDGSDSSGLSGTGTSESVNFGSVSNNNSSYSNGTTNTSSGSGNSGVSDDTAADTAVTQSGLVDTAVQTPSRMPITLDKASAEDVLENTADTNDEALVNETLEDTAPADGNNQNQDISEDTNEENKTENSTLSISTAGITALPQKKIDITPVPLTDSLVNSDVELQESLLPEATSDADTKSDSQPTRQPFSLSYGYGHLRSSFALANASLELPDLKTGDTPEGVMIVPKALTRACNNKGYKIDYKSVADREDEEFDKCLVAMNAERKSSDVSQDMRESAAKIMNDAYADYLASSYLTALNVYNESLMFKKKKVAPILRSHASNIRDAWTYVKEMNELTGTRLNQWSVLTTRLTLQEMFEPYATLGLSETETK
jgi:hypothetical protein